MDHLALEASSHGLAQYRLDGLRLAAGAFTNMTRDHLDYHADFEDYFAAKMRLFEELLPAGAPAVINADSPQGGEVARRAAARGLKSFTVGRSGDGLKLIAAEREGFGQQACGRGGVAAASHLSAAGGRLPGFECAGRGGTRHRYWRRRSTRHARARIAERRQGPSRPCGDAAPRARRSSSTMRTRPMRWKMPSSRSGPMRRAGSPWCSAAAATATTASGR